MKTQPYTQYAGQTTIIGAPKDQQGNALGTSYDLANDGAFNGETILVLHFYTEGFDFREPQLALESKGFTVVRYTTVPSLDVFVTEWAKASQLWVISDQSQQLNGAHIAEIETFFHSGKGLFLWGDNDPYHADANAVSKRLFSASIKGYFHGDNVVVESRSQSDSGFIQHLITTGLEHLYEGITVSNVHDSKDCLQPIMTGSDSAVITAIYDRDGKRAIIDGGFTRLYTKWDEAGTARFVKNAASWLVNWERFKTRDLRSQSTETSISPPATNRVLDRQSPPRDSGVHVSKPGSLSSQRRDS